MSVHQSWVRGKLVCSDGNAGRILAELKKRKLYVPLKGLAPNQLTFEGEAFEALLAELDEGDAIRDALQIVATGFEHIETATLKPSSSTAHDQKETTMPHESVISTEEPVQPEPEGKGSGMSQAEQIARLTVIIEHLERQLEETKQDRDRLGRRVEELTAQSQLLLPEAEAALSRYEPLFSQPE